MDDTIIKIATLFALNTLTYDVTDDLIENFNNEFNEVFISVDDTCDQIEDIEKKIKKLTKIKNDVITYCEKPESESVIKKITYIDNKLKEINSNIDRIKNRNTKFVTNAIGKYNSLKNIPDPFIKGLAQVLRLRGDGSTRNAFDLTSSVLIDDKNERHLAKSRVMFYDDGTKFTELPLNFFKKEFDSSLYASLRRLFVEFDLKFDSNYIKNENNTSDHNVYTLIELIGKRYELYIKKTYYNDYRNEYTDKQFVNNNDAFCFHTFKLKTFIGNLQLNFNNIHFNNETINGNITIDAPTEYFNHAACRGTYLHSYNRKIKDKSNKIESRYIILKHNATFVMNNNQLVITIIPNVIL